MAMISIPCKLQLFASGGGYYGMRERRSGDSFDLLQISLSNIPSEAKGNDDFVSTYNEIARLDYELDIYHSNTYSRTPVAIDDIRLESLYAMFRIEGDYDEAGYETFVESYEIELGRDDFDKIYIFDDVKTLIDSVYLKIDMKDSLKKENWTYEIEIDGE